MSTDYIHEDSRALRQELDTLRDKIDQLTTERESALRAGLDGPAAAAGDEIPTLRKQCSAIEKKISIIDRGFPLWEKDSFESALEVCNMIYEWKKIADAIDVVAYGYKEARIRVPLDAQKKYRDALNLGLFGRFAICYAFEPEDEEPSGTSQRIDYYLFGSPPKSEDIFLIAQWSI